MANPTKYRVFYRTGRGFQRKEYCIEFQLPDAGPHNPAVVTMVAYGAMFLEGVEFEEDMQYALEQKVGRKWVEVDYPEGEDASEGDD